MAILLRGSRSNTFAVHRDQTNSYSYTLSARYMIISWPRPPPSDHVIFQVPGGGRGEGYSGAPQNIPHWRREVSAGGRGEE